MSRVYLGLLFFLFTVTLAHSEHIQAKATLQTQLAHQHVLVLDSYQMGLPIPQSIHKGLFSALRTRGFSAANVYVEHLDFYRDPDQQRRANMASYLQYRLAGKHIDLVITLGADATDYMAKEGQSLFPDAATLALVSPNYDILSSSYKKAMSIPWQVDVRGTVNAAVKLFPKSRKLFVITGANDKILPFIDDARKALAPFKDSLEITYSNTMTYEEMLMHVSSLPPDALILYSPFFVDSKGETFVPAEVVVEVTKRSPVPVFATLEEYLGSGIVGGSLLKTEDIGSHAGKLVIDYFNGNLSLTAQPKIFPPPIFSQFDWHELTRWKASPAVLPADSIIINREPTLWGQYKTEVMITVFVLLALFLLLVFLMILNRNLVHARKIAIENELRYKEMIQSAPEAIIIYDVDLKTIIDCNSKAEELFGCSRAMLLQGGPERFYSTDQPDGQPFQDTMSQRVTTALEGEEIIFERAIHNEKGVDLICEVRLVLLPASNKKLLRGSFIDVTERKKAEEKLLELQTDLQNTFDISPGIIAVANLKTGLFTECNPAVTSILGYSEEEFKAIPIMEMIHPDDRQRTVEEISKQLEGGMIPNFQNRYLCKNGSWKWLAWGGTAADNNGNVHAVATDITPLKNAEIKTQQLAEDLKQKNIELERFVYTVSHDLKSPLVTISNFSGMVEEDLIAGDQENCKKNLDVISHAAKRMQQLLSELLNISRVGVKMNPTENVNLGIIIKEAIEAVSGIISENNTSIEVEPDLPDVIVDKQYLLQAMENLLTNASRYSRSAKDGSHVKIGVVRDADELTCYVKDNGIGIEPQYLEKIFGLFDRLDTDSDSSGVGLAIVKRIIETHGGRIWAESEGLGKGTTFYFTVPVA